MRAIAAAALGVPATAVLVVSAVFDAGSGVLTVVLNVAAAASVDAAAVVQSALQAPHNVAALNDVYQSSGGTGAITFITATAGPATPSSCTTPPGTFEFPVRSYAAGSACEGFYNACASSHNVWRDTVLVEQCSCDVYPTSFSAPATAAVAYEQALHCIALLTAYCDAP